MPPRLTPLLRAAGSRAHSTPTTTAMTMAIAKRTMAASSHNHADSHDAHGAHESHYDEPGGWLFGMPPGKKREREPWELIWYWGYFGTFFAVAVAYVYKPDTSIQTWALEEARRRLETEGVIPDSTKPVRITDELKTVSGK